MNHPDGDTKPGTRVRVIDPKAFSFEPIPLGLEGIVRWRPFGPHATANGGGWDVSFTPIDGRRCLTFLHDGQGNFARDENGKFIIVRTASGITLRSTSLEVVITQGS